MTRYGAEELVLTRRAEFEVETSALARQRHYMQLIRGNSVPVSVLSVMALFGSMGMGLRGRRLQPCDSGYQVPIVESSALVFEVEREPLPGAHRKVSRREFHFSRDYLYCLPGRLRMRLLF